MTFQLLIQALKGGPGSGNWGHAGRPGKHGGSAPGGGGARIVPGGKAIKFGDDIVTVTSPDDLKVGNYGKAYYILPNDQIVDVSRSGNDHAYAAMRLGRYDPRYKVANHESYGDFTYNAVAQGAIRGRSKGDDTFITLPKLDSANLRRLQKLVDDGKIKLEKNVRLVGNVPESVDDKDTPFLDANFGDVMFARGIRVTPDGIKLKSNYDIIIELLSNI